MLGRLLWRRAVGLCLCGVVVCMRICDADESAMGAVHRISQALHTAAAVIVWLKQEYSAEQSQSQHRSLRIGCGFCRIFDCSTFIILLPSRVFCFFQKPLAGNSEIYMGIWQKKQTLNKFNIFVLDIYSIRVAYQDISLGVRQPLPRCERGYCWDAGGAL